MKRLGFLVLAVLVLAACEEPRSPAAARQSTNTDKYARDRDYCRAQVDEQMRTRRTIDDTRGDAFSTGDQMGRSGLPTQMSNYGDTRTVDKMMGSCMEQRGWAQPKQEWWQKLGQPHAI